MVKDDMKGIILAGGSGTRLYPLTIATSKQLLPVYDKPMIFYPLSTLMEAGIKDILIISTANYTPFFKTLLGDGSDFGISISYEIQPNPDGLAQAFIIGEKFINEEACVMILGDNIFHGNDFKRILKKAVQDAENGTSTIFGYFVDNPERFGVIEFDNDRNVINIEEKPKIPKSNYCVTGLYFYNKKVCEYAKTIKPSNRNELEITDLNKIYLNEKNLKVVLLDETFIWLDTGTFNSLMEASNYVYDYYMKTGISLNSPEYIALKNGWISEKEILNHAKRYNHSPYGDYLKNIISDFNGKDKNY